MLFKVNAKSVTDFPKDWKIWKKKIKICYKIMFFVSLPSESWQLQKQLMTKSEMRPCLKLLGNH